MSRDPALTRSAAFAAQSILRYFSVFRNARVMFSSSQRDATPRARCYQPSFLGIFCFAAKAQISLESCLSVRWNTPTPLTVYVFWRPM